MKFVSLLLSPSLLRSSSLFPSLAFVTSLSCSLSSILIFLSFYLSIFSLLHVSSSSCIFSHFFPSSIIHSLHPYLSVWLWSGPGRFLCAAGGVYLHSGLPAAVRDSLLQLPGLHRGRSGFCSWQDISPPLFCLRLLQVRSAVWLLQRQKTKSQLAP